MVERSTKVCFDGRGYKFSAWNLFEHASYSKFAGFDTGFFARGGGILASDSTSGQDVGICIVCNGLLIVFVFWYFDIVHTHTNNYAKADIKRIWFAQL